MTRSLRRGCRVRLLGYVSCISFSFSFIPFFLFRSLFVAGFRLLSVFFQFRLFAYLRPEIHRLPHPYNPKCCAFHLRIRAHLRIHTFSPPNMTRDSDCTQPRSVSCEAPRVFHVHYVNIAIARTLGTRALTYDDEKRVLMH